MKKHQTCAACRFKRCKCGPDCPMAPYFPAHMHHHYKNAHKVFGESHIKKLLRSVPPHNRSTAMKHIIAEAGIRVADPVGGSYGLIRNLQLKIAEEEENLRRLRDVLSVFCGGGSGDGVVAQGVVQKQGCIVPGGFLHALFLQEQGNNMCVRDEVVPKHDVESIQGEQN
ncbi:PREDICTED: LOB domain-containing protein 22-like isoform X1 [Fragaria vesca subsp. vesca]|uniref:LOB domain-containing protein 22-like isoform X1 n=1 Tax=Fragaria vesca subsp. vesca TaxID=101020 RepID=UPI0002C2DD29|nr:PREDICTED: LOB domain-containing protein 22-like isoform X1 [Fragaria vesca subsp. vesca]